MRNLRHSRNLALVIALIGVAAMALAARPPSALASELSQVILLLIGSTAILGGLGTAFFQHMDLRT